MPGTHAVKLRRDLSSANVAFRPTPVIATAPKLPFNRRKADARLAGAICPQAQL